MIAFLNRHSAIICYYLLLSESLYISMKASKTKTSVSISQDFSSSGAHKNRYMTFVEKYSSPVHLKERYFFFSKAVGRHLLKFTLSLISVLPSYSSQLNGCI